MEGKTNTNAEMKSSQRSTNTSENIVKDMDDRTEKHEQDIDEL